MKKSRRYCSPLPSEICEEIWNRANLSTFGGRNFCVVSRTIANKKKIEIYSLRRYIAKNQFTPWRQGISRTFYLTFGSEIQIHTENSSSLLLYALLLIWISFWLPIALAAATITYKVLALCMILLGAFYVHFFKARELKHFGFRILDQFIRKELGGVPLRETTFFRDSETITRTGDTLIIQNSNRYPKRLWGIIGFVIILFLDSLLLFLNFPLRDVYGRTISIKGLNYQLLLLFLFFIYFLVNAFIVLQRYKKDIFINKQGICFSDLFIPWEQIERIGLWDQTYDLGYRGLKQLNYLEGIAILPNSRFHASFDMPDIPRCLPLFHDSSTPLWRNSQGELCLAVPPEIRAIQALAAIYAYMDEHNIILASKQNPY